MSAIERGELCVPARVIGGVYDSWYNVRRNRVAATRFLDIETDSSVALTRLDLAKNATRPDRLAAKENVSRNTSAVVVASKELAALEFLPRRYFLSFN